MGPPDYCYSYLNTGSQPSTRKAFLDFSLPVVVMCAQCKFAEVKKVPTAAKATGLRLPSMQ